MAPSKAYPLGKVHPLPQENAAHNVAKNPSAQWLMSSIDVLISSYSDILKLLPLSESPDFKLVDKFLEDIINVIDACSQVKEVISDLQHYQLLIHKALRCVEQKDFNKKGASSTLSECLGALKSQKMLLRTHSSISRSMDQKLGSLRISKSSLCDNMQNVVECTEFVLKILLNSLSVNKKQRDESTFTTFCRKLRNPRKFHSGFCCQLEELHRADVSVRNLYSLVTEKQQSHVEAQVKEEMKTLEKYEADLQEGICSLSMKVEGLYALLIRTRVASLDVLTYSI
ncbi:hypothetical protein SUGI_0008820 [Cryptomeria japonica]|nr:hypothetical protein SUGI_0008820 [Cryptomeria japonica]